MKALLLTLLLGSDWDFAVNPPPSLPDYYAVRAQAVKENKPLLVWIGYSCKSSERQVPEFLHVHLNMADARAIFPTVLEPSVVVAKMEGGILVWNETVAAKDVCASALRRAVAARQESVLPRGWSGGGD